MIQFTVFNEDIPRTVLTLVNDMRMYFFSADSVLKIVMKIDSLGKKNIRKGRMEERAGQGSWGGHMDAAVTGKTN